VHGLRAILVAVTRDLDRLVPSPAGSTGAQDDACRGAAAHACSAAAAPPRQQRAGPGWVQTEHAPAVCEQAAGAVGHAAWALSRNAVAEPAGPRQALIPVARPQTSPDPYAIATTMVKSRTQKPSSMWLKAPHCYTCTASVHFSACCRRAHRPGAACSRPVGGAMGASLRALQGLKVPLSTASML